MNADHRGSELVARRLLRKFRSPSSLERDELAQALRASYRCATAREAVEIAIERGLRAHDPRLATIVQRCDVDGALTHRVAEELHFSPRHFFRFRREAVAAIGVEIGRALGRPESPRESAASPARRAYALARYLLQRFGDDEDTRVAVCWLEHAVELDPRFLDAWILLANTNVGIALASSSGAHAALRRARACLNRAAFLAPHSPHVAATAASVTLWESSDIARARELALDALERDDRNAQAHFALAWSHALDDDLEAAARNFARAAELESSTFRYLAAELIVPFFRGDHADVTNRAHELLRVEPTCGFVLGYLAESLNATGRYRETIQAVEAHAPGQTEHSPSVAAAYAGALARIGDTDRATALRHAFVGPAVMRASIDVALENPGRALDELERATNERNGMLAVIGYDPAFVALRDEPRLERIVATARERAVAS